MHESPLRSCRAVAGTHRSLRLPDRPVTVPSVVRMVLRTNRDGGGQRLQGTGEAVGHLFVDIDVSSGAPFRCIPSAAQPFLRLIERFAQVLPGELEPLSDIHAGRPGLLRQGCGFLAGSAGVGLGLVD